MANVKLLLKESVKNVGRVGDLVEVSPGYARNFLLPKDLAVHPTPGNVKKVEERKKEVEKQERERREQQAVLIKTLSGVEVTLERRANEQGHLFGSVTATDIAKALQGQGYNVEAADVNLPGKLDRIDTYQVVIRFRPRITGQAVLSRAAIVYSVWGLDHGSISDGVYCVRAPGARNCSVE